MQLEEADSIDGFKGNVSAKFQVVINSLTKHCCLNILADHTSEILYQQLQEWFHKRLQYYYKESKTHRLWIQEL